MLANLFLGLIDNAKSYVLIVYEPLARDFQTTAVILLTLYLLLTLLIYVKSGVSDVLGKMLFGALVFTITYNLVFTEKSQGFKDWVYHPIYNTSSELTWFFVKPTDSHTDAIGVFNSFEDTALKMFDVAAAQQKSMGWRELLSTAYFKNVLWFIIVAVFYAVIVFFFIYVLLGFYGLHILLVAAPVMLLLAGIPMTRHIFTSWLKAVFTFALIPVWCGVIMGMMYNTVKLALGSFMHLANSGSVMSVITLGMLLAFIFTIMMLRKSPEFASALTGGVMTSMGGMAGILAGGAAAYSMTAGRTWARGLGQAGTEKLGNLAGRGAKSFMERRLGKQS